MIRRGGDEGQQLSIQGLSEILTYDESLDDLDEEIKMIVARGESTSKVQNFDQYSTQTPDMFLPFHLVIFVRNFLLQLPLPTADDVISVLKHCETGSEPRVRKEGGLYVGRLGPGFLRPPPLRSSH